MFCKQQKKPKTDLKEKLYSHSLIQKFLYMTEKKHENS
jgi:hypothetical protein